MKRGLRTVIWPLELFRYPSSEHDGVLRLIAWWEKVDPTVRFQPVWVREGSHGPTPDASQDRLYSWLQSRNLRTLLPPKIFSLDGLTNHRLAAYMVTQYACLTEADYVVAHHHHKSIWNKIIMGSFSETLMSVLRDVPLILTKTEPDNIPINSRILLLTDFSDDSLSIFEDVVSFASTFAGEIVMYSKVEYDFPWLVSSGYPLMDYENYRLDCVSEKMHQAEALEEYGRQHHVPVRTYIDTSTRHLLEAVEVYLARNPCQFIALESRAGSLLSTLTGSFAKQFVDRELGQVLIVHPDRKGRQTNLLRDQSNDTLTRHSHVPA